MRQNCRVSSSVAGTENIKGLYQVFHQTYAPLSLGYRRCEIADLLIISYNPSTGSQVRATFLQAKRSTNYLRRISQNSFVSFSADMVQWSLLSQRPTIRGAGRFAPPANLLSSASLPSIGSFGFFYPTVCSHYDMVYASADSLQPQYFPRKKRGYVKTLAYPTLRKWGNYWELIKATNLCEFCAALAASIVGSPIDRKSVAPNSLGGSTLGRWLFRTLAQLAELAAGQNNMASLAAEAMTLLQFDSYRPSISRDQISFKGNSYESPQGLPSILVIRTSGDPESLMEHFEILSPEV